MFLENASEGKLVWHFAFKDVNYSIEQVKVKVQADVFENGNITCVICCEDICVKVKQGIFEL